MARTVLIVEDTENVAALEIALTAVDGLTILTLSNGRDALRVLDSNIEVVAVVTDLHLPYIDGFELIQAIRVHHRYSRLPIVVVSGDSHPDVPNRLRVLGANAFFAKPYSPAKIRQTLEGLIHAQ